MTECERLIIEGKLDKDFLQEENRCGYPIDIKKKKLWAMQIDLVKQIELICNRHGLMCFLVGGGCIGAIRHHGYIPWDDDLDVALKRKDYNVFIEIAKTELSEPYFLQTSITDQYFYKPFVAIRNSNGTCISKGDQKNKCNNGIVIHVFPLDGYEDNIECKLFEISSHIKNSLAIRVYKTNVNNKSRLYKWILAVIRRLVFPFGILHYYVSFNKKCTKLSEKYKNKIGVQYTHYTKPCHKSDACLFNSTLEVPFEYTTLPIPEGYHRLLTETYGDYMQFPPEEQRVDKHAFEIEPDLPYKDYCSCKYNVEY